MTDKRLEVTVPVQLTGGLSFRIEQQQWEAMSETDRLALIKEHVAICQRDIDRAGTATPQAPAMLYFVIGDVDTAAMTSYDPLAEGQA